MKRRKRNKTVTAALLLASLAFGCRIPTPKAGNGMEHIESEIPIAIEATTPEAIAVCRELHPFDDPSCRISGPSPESGVYTTVTGETVDESLDLIRNIGFSLVTLTTEARVTTSAILVLHFDVHDGKRITRFTLRHRHRSGLHVFLPIYTGLFGTIAGTMLNRYRRPDRLKKGCEHEFQKRTESGMCREYIEFVREAFREMKGDFYNQIRTQMGYRYEFQENAIARKNGN